MDVPDKIVSASNDEIYLLGVGFSVDCRFSSNGSINSLMTRRLRSLTIMFTDLY